MEFVNSLDEEEDHKGDDKEVDDVLDEVTVGDGSTAFATKEIWDGNAKRGEIKATADEADNWHDDVVNDWGNDSSKGRTDDDAYSEVHDVATVDEIGKFFAEARAFAASFFNELFWIFLGFFFWHKFLSLLRIIIKVIVNGG